MRTCSIWSHVEDIKNRLEMLHDVFGARYMKYSSHYIIYFVIDPAIPTKM